MADETSDRKPESAVHTLPVGPRVVVVQPHSDAGCVSGRWAFEYAVVDCLAPEQAVEFPSDEHIEAAVNSWLSARHRSRDAGASRAVFSMDPYERIEVLTGTVAIDWNLVRQSMLAQPIRDAVVQSGPDAAEQGLIGGALAVLLGNLVFATHLFCAVPPMSDTPQVVSGTPSERARLRRLESHLEEFAEMLSFVRGYAEIVETARHRDAVERRKQALLDRGVAVAPSVPSPFCEAEDCSATERHRRYQAPRVRYLINERLPSPPEVEPISTTFERVILFSGGIDSCLLAQRSMAGRAESDESPKNLLLHITSNVSSRISEMSAAKRVAQAIGAADSLLVGELLFPTMAPLGRRFSRIFGRYPYFNSVPHGRDLLLMSIAACVARRIGVRELLPGYEQDSESKMIGGSGVPKPMRHLWDRSSARNWPRSDFEHREWHGRLLQYVTDALAADPPFKPSHLLYCIGGLQDSRRDLLAAAVNKDDDRSSLLALTSSCFWGGLCERCVKCIAEFVFLEQVRKTDSDHRLRECAREVLSARAFASSPLDDPLVHELIDLLDGVGPHAGMQPERIAYGALIVPAIERLAESEHESYWVDEYRAKRGLGESTENDEGVR